MTDYQLEQIEEERYRAQRNAEYKQTREAMAREAREKEERYQRECERSAVHPLSIKYGYCPRSMKR